MRRRYLTSLIPTLLFTSVVCAQTTVTPKPKLAQIDPNKFALIIDGASGEEEYGKQFQQWTNALRDALTSRYGFDTAKLKLLSENSAPRSTADEVRRTFNSLKSDLQPDNVL